MVTGISCASTFRSTKIAGSERALNRFLGLRSSGQSGEVEVEFLIRREADERPVVDEAPAVAVAEAVEDDAADGGESGWDLEQADQLLDGEAAGGLGFLSGLDFVQKQQSIITAGSRASFRHRNAGLALDDSCHHSER